MSQRDGMRVEQALGRLGPLAILGSAFLLGGLLGAALVSMIAQPAAEALSAYLRDYLTAGQAGKVAVGFWPMGAGTVFLWGLRSGAHGPGYSGDPRPLRGAGIFVCLFGGGLLPGLRSGWAGTGPVPFRPSRLSLGAYPVSGGDPEHGGFRKPVSTGNGGRERAASLRAALLGASGPLGTGAVPVCCAGISGRARAAVCLSPVCAVIGINM